MQTNKLNILAFKKRLLSSLKTTPGALMGFTVACIMAVIIMTISAYSVYSGLYTTVKTVGQDSAPSIIAAEKIGATLADANANAMNAILIGEKTKNDTYWKAYRSDIDTAHDNLITAAQNITYPPERTAILAMQTKLSDYESIMGRTQGKPIQEAMPDFVAAQNLMQQNILPKSQKLDEINFKELNDSYKNQASSHSVNMKIYIFTVILLFGILIKVQYYLFHKTKRMANIGLVVATIMCLVFQFYTVSTFVAAQTNLKVAKEDAFDSLHALWQARAIAYNSNADESLFLIYHGNTSVQNQVTIDFHNKAKQITDIDPQIAATTVVKPGSAYKFGGYLGNELANITFSGEKEAATTTLIQWAEYIKIDQQIRSLEKQGKYQDALQLNIGTNSGQSNYVFGLFDEALGKTLEINQNQFDVNIEKNFRILNKFPYILGVTAILIIIACVVGLKARIDEYRF